MSTCPEKSLHSVYLDGELTGDFAKQYEAHVATCPECQKIVEGLKTMCASIKADSDSISFSKQDLDDSFQRLMFKMSYHEVTKKAEVKKSGIGILKYAGVGIAAAAVMAFALPLGLSGTSSAASSNSESQSSGFVASTQFSIPQGRMGDGKLNNDDFVNFLLADPNGTVNQVNYTSKSVTSSSETSAPSVSASRPDRRNLANHDMFMKSPEEMKTTTHNKH